jgi:hypothetical protein
MTTQRLPDRIGIQQANSVLLLAFFGRFAEEEVCGNILLFRPGNAIQSLLPISPEIKQKEKPHSKSGVFLW